MLKYLSIFNIIYFSVLIAQTSRDEVVQILYPTDGEVINNDTVDVIFNVADFFQLGDGQTDDGYIIAYLDNAQHGTISSGSSYQLPDLLDGNYFLKLEAVDPSGESFSPEASDTVSFSVNWQEDFCPPAGLEVSSTTSYGSLVLNWEDPAGSGGGFSEDFIETFDTELPDDWTIINNGTSPTDTWFWTTEYVSFSGSNTIDGTPFVMVNSDAAGSSNTLDEELHTPAINTQGMSDLHLSFDHYFNTWQGSDDADVDVWDGDEWVTIASWGSADIGAWSAPDQQVLDISDYANSELQIRFHYYNSTYQYYWALDNLAISATAPGERSVYAYTLTEFGWDMNTFSKEELIEKYPANEGPYSIVDESSIVEHIVNTRDEIPTCGNLQGYDIYRDGSVVAASVDTNYYIDESVTLGTTYCYTVKAVYLSEAGSTVYSDASNQACGVPESYNPPPPTYLSAIEGDEEVTLSWLPPSVVLTEGEICAFPIQGGTITDGFSENFSGTTVGFENDYVNGSSANGPDVVYEFTVDGNLDVIFSLCDIATWDTYLILLGSDCETQVTFDDDGCPIGLQSEINGTLGSGTYILVVDGWGSTSQGEYTLSVSATASDRTSGVFQPSVTDENKLNNRDLTGSEITSIDDYIAGIDQTLDFNFHVESPDFEYGEGFILTFPEDWVVIGGTMLGIDASDVSGNIITFGDPYAASGIGPFSPGDYAFEVTLSAPAGGGDVTVDYYIGGDTYGEEPHSIEGFFTLEENILETGDLMGYNTYVDGSQHNTDIIGLTNYTVYGLTNNITYALGVTAVYFIGENETSESEAITITATPTYLFGDIAGVVTDPYGATLDSVIVSCGNVSDTTGTDGTFTLWNLNTGSQTVTLSRSGFYSVSVDTAVLAQAEPTILDIMLSPDMSRPSGLDATPLDEQVYLSWGTPGSGEELTLQYDDGVLSNSFYFFGTYEDGLAHGVRFDVGGSFDVMAASVKILSEGDAFWPWPNNTHGPVRVLIFDDDNGIPGNLLHDEEAVAEDGFATVYPDLSGLEGSVYVIASHTSNWTDPEGFGVDGGVDYPDNMVTLYYGEWNYGDFLGYGGDYMMAVQVMSYGGGVRTLSSFDNAPEMDYNGVEINSSLIASTNNLSTVYLSETLVPTHPVFNQPINTLANRDDLIEYRVYEVDMDGNETFVVATGDTFTTVTASPNYVEYCYNVSAYWATDNYGDLESRHSNIACTVPFTPGDADFDSEVTINDVLAVVDFILEEDVPTEDQFRNCDVNIDESINIADVVMMVDIIFDGTGRIVGFDAGEIAYIDLISDFEKSRLTFDIEYNGPVRGIEFELKYDPSMVTVRSPSLLNFQENVMVSYSEKEEGILKILAADLQGGRIEATDNSFMSILVEFIGNERDITHVTLEGIHLAGADGSLINHLARTNSSEVKVIPGVFALHQNFPNPFNPSTEIRFDLPEAGNVNLAIYNLMGQKIRTLSSVNMTPGYHAIIWDGTNDMGSQVATGMYFYSIQSNNFQATKKMLFLK